MRKLLFLLVLLWPTAIQASETICATYNAMTAVLEGLLHERKTRVGHARMLSGELVVVEVWESEGANTFTFTVVYPNGWTCLLASGEDLRFIDRDEGDAI